MSDSESDSGIQWVSVNEWGSNSFFLKRANERLFFYNSCLSVEKQSKHDSSTRCKSQTSCYFSWSSLFSFHFFRKPNVIKLTLNFQTRIFIPSRSPTRSPHPTPKKFQKLPFLFSLISKVPHRRSLLSVAKAADEYVARKTSYKLEKNVGRKETCRLKSAIIKKIKNKNKKTKMEEQRNENRLDETKINRKVFPLQLFVFTYCFPWRMNTAGRQMEIRWYFLDRIKLSVVCNPEIKTNMKIVFNFLKITETRKVFGG